MHRHRGFGPILGLLALALLATPERVAAQERNAVEIVPQIGHSADIEAVAFTPDGRFALSGGEDRALKLWDLENGMVIRSFEGHEAEVRTLSISPDGRHATSGSDNGAVVFWDVETGVELRRFRVNGRYAETSPDGRHMLTGGANDTLRLWDVQTGLLIRSFEAVGRNVYSAAFSPDGRHALWGADATLRLVDLETGVSVRDFVGHSKTVASVVFSADGARALSGGGPLPSGGSGELMLWDVATGVLIRRFEGPMESVESIALSPDGRRALAAIGYGTMTFWDVETGALIRSFDGHARTVNSVAFSPDGARVLSAGADRTLKLWDAETGALIRSFGGVTAPVRSVAFSLDGRRALVGAGDGTLKLWDMRTATLRRTMDQAAGEVTAVAFSPDGTLALSGSMDGALTLWEPETGARRARFGGHADVVFSAQFTRDGGRALSSGRDEMLKLWDITSGALIRSVTATGDEERGVLGFLSPEGERAISVGTASMIRSWDLGSGALAGEVAYEAGAWPTSMALTPDGRLALIGESGLVNDSGGLGLWEVATGERVRDFVEQNRGVNAVAVSPDGRSALSGDDNHSARLWDMRTGALVHDLEGHAAPVSAVAFTPEGRRAFTGSRDGTTRLWDVATGRELVRLAASADGEWLAMTPEGFFNASGRGADLLAVVQGLESYSVDRFYDHLRRPDLVEEALKGDPEGKVKDAASKLDLEAILESGPAPRIEWLEEKTDRQEGSARITVRLVEAGGGIGGKLVWRVNGQTQGEIRPSALAGRATPHIGQRAVATQTLRLAPDEANVIEVTAYNGRELIATPPLRITLDAFGATTEARPRMHVLAMGVDAYRMPDYRLQYAAKDATDFAAGLKTIGSGLFGSVETTLLTGEQVTPDAIAAAFEAIGAEADPRDVFVLYVSGHGKSIAGRYFYYPQSIDFKAGQSVETHGIGQERWQDWLARIPAQKTLLIFDTCESAAASGLFRGSTSVRQAAMDQLQHATGRNVIAAARQAAYEGYKGHGVLTYAILEAMAPTAEADQQVRVRQVADYVDTRVPELTASVFGVRQSPIQKLTGNNFPLGLRQAVLGDEPNIPTEPTHVVIRQTLARQEPNDQSPSNRELPPGSLLVVIEFFGDWALVARGGQELGYVPAEALLRMQ